MRSQSILQLKKRVPTRLIIAIIIVFLLFSLAVVPQYKKTKKEEQVYENEVRALNSLRQKLETLKALPAFNIYLDNKDDILLALKKVVEQNGYQITGIAFNNDQIGNFIQFDIDINSYLSIGQVVQFFESLRTMMPLYYFEYKINGRNIKVSGKCYTKN